MGDGKQRQNNAGGRNSPSFPPAISWATVPHAARFHGDHCRLSHFCSRYVQTRLTDLPFVLIFFVLLDSRGTVQQVESGRDLHCGGATHSGTLHRFLGFRSRLARTLRVSFISWNAVFIKSGTCLLRAAFTGRTAALAVASGLSPPALYAIFLFCYRPWHATPAQIRLAFQVSGDIFPCAIA